MKPFEKFEIYLEKCWVAGVLIKLPHGTSMHANVHLVCTYLQIDSLINVICNLQLIKSMARGIEAGPQIRNPFITQLRATIYKYN